MSNVMTLIMMFIPKLGFRHVRLLSESSIYLANLLYIGGRSMQSLELRSQKPTLVDHIATSQKFRGPPGLRMSICHQNVRRLVSDEAQEMDRMLFVIRQEKAKLWQESLNLLAALLRSL